MDKQTEIEVLADLITNLILRSNLSPEPFNSGPEFRAFREPELISISSVDDPNPPSFPISALMSPQYPSARSRVYNIPNSGNSHLSPEPYNSGPVFRAFREPELISISSVYDPNPPSFPISALMSSQLPFASSRVYNIPDSGADRRGLNEVRTRLLDLLQHAERISKAEKEGRASAQMNTPLHQASQAEGVDWSHIPQKTQRASESAHQEETRCVDAYMQLPMVRNVLRTGVDRNLVRYAIEGRLRETGTMFRDGEALMNAVLNFEQSREVVNTSFFDREPHRNASRSRSQNPDLETENSKLRQCNVCLVADACIHFRPCGHLCCCEACANRVNTCPLCRANIHEKLKTYFC